MSLESINRLLRLLRNESPASIRRNRWECLECARVCDLSKDDCCPTCGRELPEPDGANTKPERKAT